MKLNRHFWSTPTSAHRILLLHGMGGTGSLWRPLAAALEDSFAVLAPDQRGHGKSRVPSPASGSREETSYTPLDYGQDLVETLDEQQFYPTWVLGHSMGVRSACALAHLKPEWVQGLILIDLGFSGLAGGGLGENLARFIRVLPHRFESRADARTFMMANCPDPSIAQYLLAVAVPEKPGEPAIHFPFDSAALIATIEAARDVSVRSWALAAAQRGIPILSLRGALSQVWSQEDFEQEKQVFSPYPHVRFVEVEQTGHGLPFEKRQALTRLIFDFTQEFSRN